MRSIVVIVAKEPAPGRVKTRLCPHLSPSEAADLYTLFVQDMVEEMSGLTKLPGASSPSIAVALAYTPEQSEAAFKAMLPAVLPLFPQQGTNLGERLAGIFQKLFGEGYNQVHIINSDSPDMPRSLIGESARLLEEPHTELVLGPCPDGGYYLIGLKKLIPALFQEIPWSTDRVLDTTLQCARRLGLSYALLEPWYDIDTYDDLIMFLNRNRHKRYDGHETGWRTFGYLRRKTIESLIAMDGSYQVAGEKPSIGITGGKHK
jgi:rSAM/selenodomain-associated transferase 1